eukprot:1575079-Pleurochrysis_carterae.AAC.1
MPPSGRSQEWAQRGRLQVTWPPRANETLFNCVQEMGLNADELADEDLEGLTLDPAPDPSRIPGRRYALQRADTTPLSSESG